MHGKKRLAVLLIGPPGSGKSSIGQKLAEAQDIALIGTGNLLRKEASGSEPFHKQVREYTDAGNFVPTGLVTEVILNEVARISERIILFDGFPRIQEQLNAFFEISQKAKLILQSVIVLNISGETSIKRLSGRRICSSCGEIYNIYFNPPPETNKCTCGNKLEVRDDDKEDVVKKRLDVYEEKTVPIINYFKDNFPDLVSFVDGENTIGEVTEEIMENINSQV